MQQNSSEEEVELLPTEGEKGRKPTDAHQWTHSDVIALTAVLISVIFGIVAVVPASKATNTSNIIAQTAADYAAEANRIAIYAACQDDVSTVLLISPAP